MSNVCETEFSVMSLSVNIVSLHIPCFLRMQENISLFNAKKWMQAVVKGDSMLIIYKINVSCFYVVVRYLDFKTTKQP